MVYIYVCKRFKVTMEMVSGKDGDWVNNLLQCYCKHSRINGKLERAEINPKKRNNNCSYDSSTDVFKINLVYKDSKNAEHELKWLIKVTRSDINEVADTLLRHERQVYARLIGDLINTVKQRAAGRLEGSRITFQDLLQTPEFIFEETAHHAEQIRTVLVLDNLEEKDFFSRSPPLNLCHLRVIIKSVAKFHAVSLTYKQMLFASFLSAKSQAKASVKIDEVVMEGDNSVLTGRQGLFARFAFLTQRQITMAHLIRNRKKFLDMYQKFLRCFPEESHLVDIFEYIRISTDDILKIDEDVASSDYEDSPLDSITLGILESRSFLFRYEDDENKENDSKKKNSKLQRSQSERTKDRGSFMARQQSKTEQQHSGGAKAGGGTKAGGGSHGNKSPGVVTAAGAMPANAKCPKLEPGGGGGKMKNKFLQNVIGKSKDDVKVPLTGRKSSKVQKERDPNHAPRSAALVNVKYVTYGRITRDLAVIFWTASSSLIRRYYLIKMVECYSETLGITLGQLGIDTDTFGVKYQDIVIDFQKHVLYGFLTSVLIGMATTSPEELDLFYEARQRGEDMEVDSTLGSEAGSRQATGGSSSQQGAASQEKFLPMTKDRVSFLLDLMRDVGAYVESKDFEQGLPITNFERYHELWSMTDDDDEDASSSPGGGGGGGEQDEEDEEDYESEYESDE